MAQLGDDNLVNLEITGDLNAFTIEQNAGDNEVDGTVTGNASCNRYNGPVEQGGDRIRFGALASTRRACTDEALNQQEKSFFAALATAATARFEGTQLELRTADNALAISAVRADTE